jgi:hypothetical protein
MGMGAPEELLYLGADLDPANPLSRTPLSEYQVEQLP